VKQIRKRLTYANVMSSIAVFLVLGGATAIAANQLGKNSVGKKQIKSGAVTTAKLKKNAVTTAKIKNSAVTGAKVKDGSLSGSEINASTLATVPNSATTNVVKAAKGTLSNGQEAVVFERGPVKLSVKCTVPSGQPTYLSPLAYISSSTEGTVFTSWEDGSKNLGPNTPEEDRELNEYYWGGSTGEYNYDSASDIGVSATAADGSSFTAYLALASEKDSNTCWYWLNATIIS
jgi:hypothetical protein